MAKRLRMTKNIIEYIPRQFDSEKLVEYKADPNFDYGIAPRPSETLWDRFLTWLSSLFEQLFYFGTEVPMGKVLVYVLLGVAVLFIILKILKIDTQKLFFGSAERGGMSYTLHEEPIHEMNFDQLISEAVLKGDYRQAIRLTYLHALRHLSERHLIRWEAGKTNYEYTHELQEEKLKPGFDQLGFYFSYAWYGDFSVSENMYSEVSKVFVDWEKQLQA